MNEWYVSACVGVGEMLCYGFERTQGKKITKTKTIPGNLCVFYLNCFPLRLLPFSLCIFFLLEWLRYTIKWMDISSSYPFYIHLLLLLLPPTLSFSGALVKICYTVWNERLTEDREIRQINIKMGVDFLPPFHNNNNNKSKKKIK